VVVKHFGTHDNKQARINESLRRFDDSDDHIHGFLVGFSDRWSDSMTRSYRKTDPPSPQSAAHSTTGSSSSSSAAAARSSRGKTNIFPFSDFLFSDFFVQGLGSRV
jgi:hypothetical protein